MVNMTRISKVLFLQYLVKQEKKSMIFQVLKATMKNPVKNDFVQSHKKYFNILKIKLSFDEIAEMSKCSFKKLVKEKTTDAAFLYLMEEKNKQSKISNINYKSLEGNTNIIVSKFIFKVRC